MTSPASVRGFNLKNHEELKKNSQLIEKWHRFSLGVCEKSHTPGTDRVKTAIYILRKTKRELQKINVFASIYTVNILVIKHTFIRVSVQSVVQWYFLALFAVSYNTHCETSNRYDGKMRPL